FMQGQNAFIGSLPQAANTITLTPEQAQSMNVQQAATLFPIADFPRQLQEQDLLRQQGLAQTAFTGLPYTPQTDTTQAQHTNSILENAFGIKTGMFGTGLFTPTSSGA